MTFCELIDNCLTNDDCLTSDNCKMAACGLTAGQLLDDQGLIKTARINLQNFSERCSPSDLHTFA